MFKIQFYLFTNVSATTNGVNAAVDVQRRPWPPDVDMDRVPCTRLRQMYVIYTYRHTYSPVNVYLYSKLVIVYLFKRIIKTFKT